jgi:hypothetical protein
MVTSSSTLRWNVGICVESVVEAGLIRARHYCLCKKFEIIFARRILLKQPHKFLKLVLTRSVHYNTVPSPSFNSLF